MRSTDMRTPARRSSSSGSTTTPSCSRTRCSARSPSTPCSTCVLGVPLTMGSRSPSRSGSTGSPGCAGFFRVGYYLPVVTSIVAVSVVWKFLLRDERRAASTRCSAGSASTARAGSTPRPLALPSLVVMAVWRNFGTPDGDLPGRPADHPARRSSRPPRSTAPSAWARFRYITLPMLRPTLLFGAVITSIGYLQFFEEAFVMTKGGPLDSTRSVTFFTYDQFGFGNYGYASAASLPAVPRDRAADPVPVPAAAGARTDMTQTLTRHRSDPRTDVAPAGTADGSAARLAVRRAGRRARPGRHPVRLDAALLVQARGRGARRTPHLVAARRSPWTTTDQLFTKLDFPTLLHQLGDRRGRRHGRQHGLLLDARLRPRQARLPGQEGAVRRSCSAR